MVVVCEPGTTGLNDCPPPEHWSWYSVITPFGFRGQFHSNVIEDGDPEVPSKLAGDVFWN